MRSANTAAITFLTIVGVVSPTFGAATGEAVVPEVREFLNTYCVACHGPEKQEADFRVDELKISATATDAEHWQLVLAKLYLGEMPPEDQKQPTTEELDLTTNWVENELRRARRTLAGQTGEVVLRRLNRTEYEYSIEDLFDVRGNFTEGFPADATAEGFDNIGSALVLSGEQVSQYMQAADFVLNRAIQTGDQPQKRKSVFTLHDYNKEAWKRHREKLERQQRDFALLTPNDQQRAKEMLAEFKTDPYLGFSFPVWTGQKLRTPTPDDGPEVDGVIAIQVSYATPDTRRHFSVRHAGWYRFRVTAYPINDNGEPVRLKISYGSFRQGTIPEVADVIHLTESSPQHYEYRIYLQPNNIVKLQMLDGQRWTRREDQVNLPGPFVAIRSMEMEGPLFDLWPPLGHQTLLGDRDANSLRDEQMPVILAELAPRLFRRPVSETVIQQFIDFYETARDDKLAPIDAFKLTVKAMMASPYFLYHVEVGDQPDAFAVANRLSYFLWRSVPDVELWQLADTGKLLQKDALRQQVDRMLKDEKSERFLKDFVGQWLDIQRVGEMQPDKNLYPEYDTELEHAMVGETESFIREMLHQDHRLTNLIHSDWMMLNDRMAKHYGIDLPSDDLPPNRFRKVTVDDSTTVRGGLMTQAGILNITSNGTTTSPVVRGVWVLERLLGKTVPPPPPDVPAIEPDIRGANTIQEQLARHRSIAQCASCHDKIDPYGFALENFDVIGGWRNKYRALEPTANVNRPKLVGGPTVIASGHLPRYGEFEGFLEFRSLLHKQEEQVYQNMARQLATFALGRGMHFADQESLDQIVAQTRTVGGGLKTMIQELVANELFQRP